MEYLNLKKTVLIYIITFCGGISYTSAQSQLTFEYDIAGNQVLRKWICLNCPAGQINTPSTEQLDGLSFVRENDSSSVTRSLKAFPNPVAETLQVEWSSNNGIFIKSMNVFSLSGIVIFKGNYGAQQNNTRISFLDLPPGGYILQALYSDGKKEILKLIKQ